MALSGSHFGSLLLSSSQRHLLDALHHCYVKEHLGALLPKKDCFKIFSLLLQNNQIQLQALKYSTSCRKTLIYGTFCREMLKHALWAEKLAFKCAKSRLHIFFCSGHYKQFPNNGGFSSLDTYSPKVKWKWRTEVRFVTAITTSGSVKILPAV